MKELGPVNPVAGAWQVAQAYPAGFDSVASKKMFLPSCSAGESTTAFGGWGVGGSGKKPLSP